MIKQLRRDLEKKNIVSDQDFKDFNTVLKLKEMELLITNISICLALKQISIDQVDLLLDLREKICKKHLYMKRKSNQKRFLDQTHITMLH